ncbi:mitochondrial distribution and morphology protein 12 [Obba rivulosa]|uniref:Mitochondrial distribution and morphology protein 12 n=1 Tax=Obba rivulosa TaxID=1052685 RepID=A0A8E2DQD9_9APHY|nr:mitochondrial distribution and morphology protein 12 [Obba rivulosa]
MSIDLEWGKLDTSLSSKLVDALNRQLANTTRPSFIGPIEVTSFDFGSTSPDIELVDLRDIYRDFLEDDVEDEEEDDEPQKVSQLDEEDEGYEWVSRKATRGKSVGEDGPAYHLLPPHMRYGRGAAMDMFSSTPSLRGPRDIWTPPDPQPNPAAHPNLQLHLHVTWHSNMRLTLTTSLLINYPSPMFMSLPIKLSVTGLLFNGETVVAYEGERRRIHLCIVDELDPYSPLAGDRPKRDTPSSGSTPPDPDDYTSGAAVGTSRMSKPLPIGQRLLPSIFIESEIGQADKHVLKNVTRVERFIQDVIRKTIEEELVFPNFHTVIIGEPES